MQNPPWILTGVLLAATVAACGKGSDAKSDSEGTPPLAAAASDDVLATVNGVPIRQADLQFVLASKRRGRGADALTARRALETIIDQELARQQAQALGLHNDADYQRKLHFMQAPVNDFERDTLSESYFKQLVDETATVSDAEARAHFAANPERFQTNFWVSQILVKNDDATIRDLKQKIASGTPFSEAAATLFPPKSLAVGATPWELGPLRWEQLPGPWQEVLPTMKEGEVSDVLRGPNNRSWLIRLVKRERDESATFESLKPQVMAALQNQRARDRAQEAAKELRRKAAIVHVRDPEAMPPAPEPD